MTIYDAAFAVVVVGGMIWGAWRGITWQIASIASLVLGYLVAYPLSGQIADRFPGEPVVARGLALLAAYAIVSASVFGAAWIVRATLRRLKFEAFDRHLGMVLGGLEGAFLGMVVTLFVVSLAPSTREPIFTSPSGRVVGQVMDALGPALPGEAREVLKPFWEQRGGSLSAAEDRAITLPRFELKLGDGGRDQQINFDPEVIRSTLKETGARLGRAIADEAEKSIDRMSQPNDRTTQRR